MNRAAVLVCATVPMAILASSHSADAKTRKHHRHHYHHHIDHDPAIRSTDLTPTLQAKVQEIRSACGSKLISAYRPHALIAGTHHPSLHSVYPARAADMSGNPRCIYSHLQGWKGGYSVDYGHVRHVHISWSPRGTGYLAGREWGSRFYHNGGHSHHRYARRATHLSSIDYTPAHGIEPHSRRMAANRAHDYAVECGLMDACR